MCNAKIKEIQIEPIEQAKHQFFPREIKPNIAIFAAIEEYDRKQNASENVKNEIDIRLK